MSVESILEDGRAAMLTRMTELIRVGTSVDSTDPETGDAITQLVDVVYGGDEGAIGQIKYVAESVQNSSGTGQTIALQRPVLKVPTTAPRLDEGRTVYVVSSRVDGLLAGRVYTVAGSPDAGQSTAHRYPLTELS